MNPLHVVNTSKDLDTYLTFLFGLDEGFIYIATKEEASWTQKFFEWPSQRSDVIEFIEKNSEARDVYIAPALFSSPDSHKENFKSSLTLWVEFDGRLPNNEQLASIPPPTLRVRSSDNFHEHWYWRLETAITDQKILEGFNRNLTYRLGADSSGWDCNQVLRPVSTFNHRKNLPVLLLALSDSRYFQESFRSVPAAPPQTVIPPTSIPNVTEVILKFPFPLAATRLFISSSIEMGKRSTALMELGFFCAEMGMDNGEILACLYNADNRWGKFKGRPDQGLRLLEIVTRSRVKYPVVSGTVNVMGIKTLLAHVSKIEWAIEGLLEERGYMLLTGPSGVGKTQVSLQFAIHMALGENYLGFSVTRPQKIVFFSLEMSLAPIQFFISSMMHGKTLEQLAILEKNLLVIPLGEAIYLDTPKGQEVVEKILSIHDPDGYFIDSLGSTTANELSSEGPVKAIMDWNDRSRNKYDCYSWIIHHQRKASGDNKKPNKLADVYGSQYIVNRATSVYCLWIDTPGNPVIEVIPLKKRLAVVEPSWHIKRGENLSFTKKIFVPGAFSDNAIVISDVKPNDSIQGSI